MNSVQMCVCHQTHQDNIFGGVLNRVVPFRSCDRLQVKELAQTAVTINVLNAPAVGHVELCSL
ncbi:hypothetical protein D3C75_982980 [compost metagenome]